MPPGKSLMSYYKSENDQVNGKEALGAIDVAGSTVFLKEVSKTGVYRFTVRTTKRELKLRAKTESDYTQWIAAIKPYARPPPYRAPIPPPTSYLLLLS